MSVSPETVPEPAARRDRSVEARRAARHQKEDREARIVRMLTAGVSVAEIARREGVTQRRMRAIVQELLAERKPDATLSEFLALQVGRLGEALIVAHGAMSNGNMQAVDRVIKIVRELDRYHGFLPAPAEQRLIEAPPPAALLLATPQPRPAENGAASN